MPVDLDRILTLFEEINTIPRCSGNEAGVRRWLRTWALDRNLASREDAAGNLVVQLPATGGANKGLPVVIQGHMDMVCEKRPDVQHDFTRDPIRCLRQDEWLT
ncbi:MAG: aminoacyl-histidine dipeptidase, partial [Desulfatitalea sp.]|nr:hypothetical protein [Desulfatitalea sp.]NNK00105.1 aminoacyl-histidine dipeptidase [Desulfatitalea sp.]